MERFSVTDARFAEYGFLAAGYPLSGLLEALAQVVPEPGQIYQPREELLHRAPGAEETGDAFFGGLPYQWGWCALEHNESADALAFHGGCTLAVGLTDWDVILLRRADLKGAVAPAARAVRVHVPAGVAIGLYGDTLRSLPLGRVLRVLAGLPYATNTAYDDFTPAAPGDGLLRARNQWLARLE